MTSQETALRALVERMRAEIQRVTAIRVKDGAALTLPLATAFEWTEELAALLSAPASEARTFGALQVQEPESGCPYCGATRSEVNQTGQHREGCMTRDARPATAQPTDRALLEATEQRLRAAATHAMQEAAKEPDTPTGRALLEWRPIETAPKDGTVIVGALIRDGRVWRVHEMLHNGLAFYTTAGGSLPKMTHWIPMPALRAAGAAGEERR